MVEITQNIDISRILIISQYFKLKTRKKKILTQESKIIPNLFYRKIFKRKRIKAARQS